MILLIAAAVAAAPPAPAACPDVVTSEAFVCRALVASKSGQPEAAAQAFEQAAEAQNENEAERARAWAAAGNMWIAANQPGKAAIALDKALASPQLQAEQRRGIAQAVNANHQAGLNVGRAEQEAFGIARERHARKNEQKPVDRNQHAIQAVLLPRHEHILQGREQEEHPEQRAVVARPGGRARTPSVLG